MHETHWAADESERSITSRTRVLIIIVIGIGALGAASLLALLLAPTATASVSAENQPTVVTTTVETTPTVSNASPIVTGTLPGIADGVVIWSHPTDAARSTVIGTLQDGGLAVFDLDGQLLQHIVTSTLGAVRFHGIDLVQGFALGGYSADVIIAADGLNDVPAFFAIDPATRHLVNVTSPQLLTTTFGIDDGDHTAYGLAAYTEPLSGSSYAFVTQHNGNLVAQMELFDDGAVGIAVTMTRMLTLPVLTADSAESQARGIVADPETGFLYVAMATVGGLLKVNADPNMTPTVTMVHTITNSTFLTPDLGGLTLYAGPDDTGYLLLSSRGDDSIAVLERGGDNAFVGSFVIGDSSSIDAVTGTIGVFASSNPLAGAFPYGVVAVQDSGDDSAQNATNFKLVPWENIACVYDMPLLVAASNQSPCYKFVNIPLILHNVRDTPAGVVISTKHGFDTCATPDQGTMQLWWDNSPYYDANIYIGGVARACAQPYLNADWVNAVINQGWNLIPTWVGPQAPCSVFGAKMSGDPATAHAEGRTNADEALGVATTLDLTTFGAQTILYYDIEAYDTSDSGCHAAVGAFLDGWVGRLHELGHRAGIYGLSATAQSWASHPNPPDDVWVANWIYGGYASEATVWNVYGLPNDLWTEHQRIRQYAGGHLETWGGVTINIDSNVADGHVVGVNERLNAAPAHVAYDAFAAPSVAEMALVVPDTGWIMRDSRLLWSADNGASWQDITPVGEGRLLAVSFSDAVHGYAVMQAGEALLLLVSADSGATWTNQALSIDLPVGMRIASAELDFTDSQTGWLRVQFSGSSNFAPAMLWHTTDSGDRWQIVADFSHKFEMETALPSNAPENVIAATRRGDSVWVQTANGSCSGKRRDTVGPIVCSVANGFLRSADGGATWLSFEP